MTKTNTKYLVLIGGGIGECQSAKSLSTPLQAIAMWVKGNSERSRWSAPLDCWIDAPKFGDALRSVDIEGVRAFYRWIMGNEDRLRDELYKQTSYVPEMLVMGALDQAIKYLKMSDDELRKTFELDNSLHPFSGG